MRANIALVLANEGVEVLKSALGEVLGLLAWVDLLEPLTNYLEFFLICLWATFWATAPYKSPW